MLRKLAVMFTFAFLAFGLIAPSALAAVTLNSDGTGFVGKGDVQLALGGWNNKQLQDNASGLSFEVSSTSVTETTWTCDRDGGDQTQERANTATTTTQGLVSSVARERNQITGFVLNGFSGSPTISTENDGPVVGSCPDKWTAINLVTSDPVVTGGGLSVKYNGVSYPLPITPVV